jgi:hypothetical protein
MGDQAPSCLDAIVPEAEHEFRHAFTTSGTYMSNLFMLSNSIIKVGFACIFPSNLPTRRVSPIKQHLLGAKNFLISSLTFLNLPIGINFSDPAVQA